MKYRTIVLVCVGTVLAVLFILAIVPGTAFHNYARSLVYIVSRISTNRGRNVPLEFTGQILDQSNMPVGDVNVLFDYEKTGWAGDVTRHPISTRSNKDGFFRIQGYYGTWLGFREFEKHGYYFHSWQSEPHVYVYSPSNGPKYVPDPAKPEIFYGWALSGRPERLGAIRGHGPRLPLNGEVISVYLDRFSLRTVPGTKPDATWLFSAIGNFNRTTWTLECTYTIECLDGGIQDCKDQFGFFAPKSGYEKKIIRKFIINQGQSENRDLLYWTSQDGKTLGSICLRISNFQKEIYISMSGFVNPNGSYNLEPGENILN